MKDQKRTRDVPFASDSNIDAEMCHDVVLHSRRTSHQHPLHRIPDFEVCIVASKVVSACSPDIMKVVVKRQCQYREMIKHVG